MRYSATSVLMPTLTMEEQAALLQSLGYDGIEWRVRRVSEEARKEPSSYWGGHKNDLTPENFVVNAGRMKQVAADHGLAIAGIASDASANDLEQVRLLAEGAQACGAPFIRAGCPRGYDGSVPYSVLYDEAVEAFGKMLEAIASFGMRVALEIHGGTINPSVSLAHRIVSHWPPARICVIYDPQNMVMDGYETTELAVDLLGDYLGHVHAGGHRPEPTSKDGLGTVEWDWPGVPMPEGLYDYRRLLGKLKSVGYAGFISIEDFREAPLEARLREAIGYLRAIEAGL